MVIRAQREDPADAAQPGFENGSDKVPHQKLHLGKELATGWEERLLENEAGQNRVSSKAQRSSSKEGDFFHDRDISIHAEGHCLKYH